jgi:hypothetical protein
MASATRSANQCSRMSRLGSIWSARAAALARCHLSGDHTPGNRLAASQLSEPRRGPDDDAEPAAADIPSIDANVDSELITAQLPQILMMHDASHGSQVRACSREPPRGNQHLGLGQDAHHDNRAYAPLDDHRDGETAVRREE